MKATTSWEGFLLSWFTFCRSSRGKKSRMSWAHIEIYSLDNLTTIWFEIILFATNAGQDFSGLNSYHKSHKWNKQDPALFLSTFHDKSIDIISEPPAYIAMKTMNQSCSIFALKVHFGENFQLRVWPCIEAIRGWKRLPKHQWSWNWSTRLTPLPFHLSVPSRLNFEGGRDWKILIIQDPKCTININTCILRWRLFVENWGMFKVHSEIVGKLYRQNFELLGNQSTKIQRPLVFVRRTLHSFWGKECCRENVVDCWLLPSLCMAVRVHHRPYHSTAILFLRLDFCRSSCSCRRCEKKILKFRAVRG